MIALYCGLSDETVDRLWTVGNEVRSDNTIFQVILYHSLRRSYKHIFSHILSQKLCLAAVACVVECRPSTVSGDDGMTSMTNDVKKYREMR